VKLRECGNIQEELPMPTARTARAAPPRTALDELDVVVVVHREPAWLLAAQQAALATALGPQWRGGAIVVEDGAHPVTSRAARQALAAHHPLARRTILRTGRRLGLAGATDLALGEGTGEYAALLDPRVRPEPGSLRRLLTILEDEEPEAIWAAPPLAGAVVARRAELVDLGGFDPRLAPGAAVADAVRRAAASGWYTLVIGEARFRRVELPPARALRRRPRLGTPQADWSAAALAGWLRHHRLAAERFDLP
jgi:GT2 family glycosyltransferase